MWVRLHLRLIRVLGVLVDAVEELVVEATSTRSWSRCPHCGFKTRTVHDTRIRKVRDLAVSGRRVTLAWQRRRFACEGCGCRHLEDHPAFDGKLTRRRRRLLGTAETTRATRRRRIWLRADSSCPPRAVVVNRHLDPGPTSAWAHGQWWLPTPEQ